MKTLIFTVFLTLSLFSKTILQVGAFKHQKELKKLESTLSAYNLFTKKINGYKKLYVLNPTKSQILKIKKIVPKAFLVFDKKSPSKNIHEIKLNLTPQHDGLNTKTIIKTRKKFFK